MINKATLLALVWTWIGVQAEWMAEIPDAPPRWKSKLFGIPTWIVPIEDYNADAFDTTTVFSVVVMAGASAYAIYHTFWIYLPSQPSGRKSVGRFNRLILAYLISTLIASFTFDLMNAGKIWASFGVLHNLFEIALLASIFIRRSDISDFLFVPICFLYLLGTAFAVIWLPWPLDALFFKYQGLSTDLALGLDLFRLYFHNRGIAKQTKIVTYVNDPEDDKVNDGEAAEKKESRRRIPPVHVHILVIATAAMLHWFGNALVTMSNHFLMWLIFQFLYAVAFPMYAYYVVVEPNASRIHWYKVDLCKEALVAAVSLVTCGIIIAIGILNSDHV
ncbi:hypothetical protein LRAMOSA10124 [Lichtheimia ramosa]|uniref:Uncharacterized protein n=1 Tax=Lichtheimia ramosa TaxID=688394 RepID=A0A077WNR2_9FUNG|nr:hypothetical protein LRAMOSA10124 [Lichtheimia ramosa]